MAKKQKYYVVWQGIVPGIYHSWDECQKQIKAFPNAKYKSFESFEEAKIAFSQGFFSQIASNSSKTKKNTTSKPILSHKINPNSICVDAACSGNPGNMEYRGVETVSKKELFRIGPLAEGTNNVGEFLGLVHALAFLKKHNYPNMPIYTDSKTAMSWLKNKKLKTTLARTHRNEKIFELIERALDWLDKNTYSNPILKWETEIWGEIPADFGRK